VAPETFDDAIAELKDYLWFDQRTRAAMISFAVYNGNYDMFMSVQFLFEITQAGLVLPQYKFKSLSLDHPWGKLTEAEVSKVVDKDPTTTRLTSSKDGLLYIEGVMYLLVFSFLIRELVDALRVRIKYKTFRYYFNVWAIIEDMNIAFFISGLVIRIMLMFQPTRLNFYMFAREYQELGPVASLYNLMFIVDSTSIFLCMFKVMKYLRLSPSTNLLWLTLSRAGRDILFFIITLLILMLGFIIMGEQVFGLELAEFSRPALSALTLFHMLFGIVDIFYDLLAVDMWVGLVFFFAYIFLFFLMLVNIVLAILNDAYAVTKEGVEKQIEEKREEKARLVAERRAAEEEARKAGGRRTTPKSRLKRLKLWLTRKQKVS
jgi:polycystin 1L2